VLAKLLLQNADMYLFDEPTNHLDIVAKEWFLEFLAQSNVGFVIVCHEKRFLNRVCTTIMELEHGVATQYVGNYDRYVQQKQASLERLETAYENQQRMLKQMQATIDRFRASASKARMAQSMIKKMNAIERITIPPTSKKITIAVPSPAPSGRIVLTVQDVGYCFGDKKIFEHATFTLERGNKAAIVAANGVGKTTLLNIVTGLLPLQTGSVTMGHAVTTAIFDQDQALSLDLDRTVFENASIDTQHASEQTIRALLGSFLFDHNAINKKTRVLSGGERNRLGMVRILLRNANFLLLDEPTNHLDIPSKEMLLHALQSYTGTILFVSHDYDFVNELATHIIELTVDGTALYHGNYDAYIHQKKLTNDDLATRPLPHIMSEKKVISKKPQSQEAQKEVRLLERSIERLEAEIQRVEHSFGALAYGSEDFNKATRTLKMLRVEYEQMMREWEMHVS
jgi:ATP-binding cassette subfamily F protein 3